MLDIVVGEGRTTDSFSELADRCIGIDYSENMINAFRKRFQGRNSMSFEVADARYLEL